MAYRDWEADAWFVLRFESAVDEKCPICHLPFEAGDLAYTTNEDEGQDYAHVSCADAMAKCSCCQGQGSHRTGAARPFSFISGGWDTRNWRPCSACESRGFNPGKPPCWAPGMPP